MQNPDRAISGAKLRSCLKSSTPVGKSRTSLKVTFNIPGGLAPGDVDEEHDSARGNVAFLDLFSRPQATPSKNKKVLREPSKVPDHVKNPERYKLFSAERTEFEEESVSDFCKFDWKEIRSYNDSKTRKDEVYCNDSLNHFPFLDLKSEPLDCSQFPARERPLKGVANVQYVKRAPKDVPTPQSDVARLGRGKRRKRVTFGGNENLELVVEMKVIPPSLSSTLDSP